MPPKGHKSITLREEDYAYFLEQYNAEKVSLVRQGVRSFSAYITMMLFKAFESEKK
jgi:hypothetical protein